MMRQWQGLFFGLLLSVVVMAGCGGQSGGGAGPTGYVEPESPGMPGDMYGMSGSGAGSMPMAPGAPGMMAPAPGAPGAPAGQPASPPPSVSSEEISAQRKAEAQRSKQTGDRLFKAGDYEGAISEYEMALIDDPDNAEIKRQIARAKAAKEAKKRREVQQLVSQGRSLFYRGEYMRAARVLEQAVQQDPLHEEALGYLLATGVSLNTLQQHGWPQPGLSQRGVGGGFQSGDGAAGMSGMYGGMGGAMGMPSGMGGAMGMPPGMGGSTGGGKMDAMR